MDKELPFDRCPICGAEIIEVEGVAECKNGHKTEEMLKAYAQLLKNKEVALEVVSHAISNASSSLEPQYSNQNQTSQIGLIISAIFIFSFIIFHESTNLNIMPFGLMIAIFFMFLGGIIWKYYAMHNFKLRESSPEVSK